MDNPPNAECCPAFKAQAMVLEAKQRKEISMYNNQKQSSENAQDKKGRAPTHYAYHVRDYTGSDGANKGAWTKIGSVWMHADGKGSTIKLDCIPVDGEVTIRPIPPKADNGSNS